MRDDDDEGMTPRKVRGGGGGASGPSRVRGLWRVVFCACMDQHELAVRVGLSTHSLLFGINVETPKTRRCGFRRGPRIAQPGGRVKRRYSVVS